MHACMPLFVPPNHRSRLKKNNHRRPRAAVASMDDDGCADAISPSSTRPSSTRPASRTNAVDRSLARRASRSNPPRARRRGDRRASIAPPRADLDSIAIGARSTRVVCTASSARGVDSSATCDARVIGRWRSSATRDASMKVASTTGRSHPRIHHHHPSTRPPRGVVGGCFF